MKTKALSHEAALEEMHKFLGIWKNDETYTDDRIEEDYPEVIKALESGRLVFESDKMKPKYVLSDPIKNDEGDTTLSELEFKTRIKPSTQADLADGLKLETQSLKYALRLIAFIIGQPMAMIDRFGKKDYKVVSQLASVFS